MFKLFYLGVLEINATHKEWNSQISQNVLISLATLPWVFLHRIIQSGGDLGGHPVQFPSPSVVNVELSPSCLGLYPLRS